MQLPRRVPWASIAELDQVCAWIYTDETDYSAKDLAVQRLSAWKAITPLPHALESTLAFLAAILQDNATASSSTSSYSLRQSYATAVIRLVNGLVDPLQSGAYARSIASIATQLGLPAWFVELRHAATHEDLPSLEVLREATRESLAWLLHNYFLPVLNPSSADQPHGQSMRPVLPLLKQYKALSKIVTRDASLKINYQTEITKVLRDLERWISETKVAANVSGGAFGWDVDSGEERDGYSRSNTKEQVAIEILCDGLLEKGCLVPLSKKKRIMAKDTLTPPKPLLSLWTPLLSHIQSLHSAFASTLVSRIVSRLLTDPPANSQEDSLQGRDYSYDLCLASWVVHLLQNGDLNQDAGSDYDALDARTVIISLMNGLGPVTNDGGSQRKAAKLLLKELCKDKPELAETCSHIAASNHPSHTWEDDYLPIMTERLDKLLSRAEKPLDKDQAMEVDAVTVTSVVKLPSDGSLPPGWKVLDDSMRWRPSPIGVFVS